jgi:hypothetical protein
MSTARLTIESIGPEHIDTLLAYHQRNEKHLARWEPARSSDFFTRSYWSSYAAAVQDDAYHGRAHRFVAMLRGSRQIVASVNVTNIVQGCFQAGVLGYSVDVAHQVVLPQHRPAPRRGQLPAQQRAQRAAVAVARFHGRRLRARLSLHRRRVARPRADREGSRGRQSGR